MYLRNNLYFDRVKGYIDSMSRHKLLSLVIVLLFFVLFGFKPNVIFAHPGNVAADGCHFCWTRCDYWGEVYGQRHCHYQSAEPDQPTYDEPDPPTYDAPDPEYTAPSVIPAQNPQLNTANNSALTSNTASSQSQGSSANYWVWWLIGMVAIGLVIYYSNREK